MSRLLKLSLLLLLISVLLIGCGSAPAEQEIVCNDLTLVLPATFADFSENGVKEGLAFNYADVDVGVCGSFEGKSYLVQYIPDITPEKYAELFLQTNSMASQVEVVDTIPRFTYNAAGYTYLCGVFESDENFWVVQAYCKQDDYSAHEADMWNYICSVSVE